MPQIYDEDDEISNSSDAERNEIESLIFPITSFMDDEAASKARCE